MNIVGVDIGGTFTDLVGCVDGRIVTSKTSTVPADPTRGVADSLALAHCEMPALSELLHGSTIAINTVLERKGARTALITTRGFRDTYAIGRGNRIEAFNLFFHRPKPLIPRELTFEVTERMNAKGAVLKPLDEAEVQTLAKALATQNIEAIAVSDESPAVGRTLEALALRQATGATVLAIMRDGNPVVNPPGDMALAAGDRLLAMCTRDQLERVERVLAGRR
jgi:K+/H+ antiporter YhaU regulatory subunit KhtT